MTFDWSEEKDERLRRERGISFEEVIVAVEEGNVLDILEHTNPSRYGGQRLYIIEIDSYVWVVPFVDNDEIRFLKTAFPSRKLTKRYLRSRGKGDEHEAG